MTLAELLQREIDAHHKWGTRDLAAVTKVSRGSIEAILNGSTKAPTHETFVKLGTYFKMQPIHLMRMAGLKIDDYPEGSTLDDRAIALARAMPQFAEVIRRAMNLAPAELNGLLAYLEAVKPQDTQNPVAWAVRVTSACGPGGGVDKQYNSGCPAPRYGMM